MSELTANQRYELSYLTTRSRSLVQVLGDLVRAADNDHHALVVEIIEEYLLKAETILNSKQVDESKQVAIALPESC